MPSLEATSRDHYVYDAWYRLVAVWRDDGDGNREITGETPDDTWKAGFEYDGLGRRITKVDKDADPDATYDYYYNTGWQVVAVYKTDSTKHESNDGLHRQYVWSVDYIDSLVVRYRYDITQSTTTLDDTLYYLHDANYNVTALVDTDAHVVERYYYDPYGEVTALDGESGYDGDGEVTEWTPDTTPDWDNDILFQGRRLDSGNAR